MSAGNIARAVQSVLLALALMSAIVMALQLRHTRAELAGARSRYTALATQAAAQAASAAARAKTDTAAMAAAIQETAHVARLARDRQDIERRAADAARQRLLSAAAAAAGRGQPAGDSAPAGSGLRAPGAAHLLADVLGRADQAAGDLADYADALTISLQACTASYEAVRVSAGPSAE